MYSKFDAFRLQRKLSEYVIIFHSTNDVAFFARH
jgi:hypothetical protein